MSFYLNIISSRPYTSPESNTRGISGASWALLSLSRTIYSLPPSAGEKKTPFSPCTFLFTSFLPPSQCAVVCLRLLLCQGWLGEIWERQGSSLSLPIRFETSACIERRGERQKDAAGAGATEKEDNKKMSSREERWCSVDRRLEERGESDLMNSD